MNILLVDDHPMAIEFYNSFINDFFSWKDLPKISKAFNCQQAYHLIAEKNNIKKFDFAFLDYRLPAFEEQNIFSGADIAILLRKQCPDCKIVLITGYTEALFVYDILWKVHPEGFAAKSDINFETLEYLMKSIEKGIYYKSETIIRSARKILDEKIFIDSANRKIVALIMEGHKIKDLYKYIDLKPSTIHRRILSIKKSLKIKDNTNIIKQLIDSGYIASIYFG